VYGGKKRAFANLLKEMKRQMSGQTRRLVVENGARRAVLFKLCTGATSTSAYNEGRH